MQRPQNLLGILLLLFLFGLGSCSSNKVVSGGLIQKRKYNSGFFISFGKNTNTVKKQSRIKASKKVVQHPDQKDKFGLPFIDLLQPKIETREMRTNASIAGAPVLKKDPITPLLAKTLIDDQVKDSLPDSSRLHIPKPSLLEKFGIGGAYISPINYLFVMGDTALYPYGSIAQFISLLILLLHFYHLKKSKTDLKDDYVRKYQGAIWLSLTGSLLTLSGLILDAYPKYYNIYLLGNITVPWLFILAGWFLSFWGAFKVISKSEEEKAAVDAQKQDKRTKQGKKDSEHPLRIPVILMVLGPILCFLPPVSVLGFIIGIVGYVWMMIALAQKLRTNPDYTRSKRLGTMVILAALSFFYVAVEFGIMFWFGGV